MRLTFKDASSSQVGSIKLLFFKSLEKYAINRCFKNFANSAVFPLDPPAVANKTWTLAKNTTHFMISVNGVELLALNFTASPQVDCQGYWGGDVVRSVVFSTADTASLRYRVVEYQPAYQPVITGDVNCEFSTYYKA